MRHGSPEYKKWLEEDRERQDRQAKEHEDMKTTLREVTSHLNRLEDRVCMLEEWRDFRSRPKPLVRAFRAVFGHSPSPAAFLWVVGISFATFAASTALVTFARTVLALHVR